MKLSAKQRKTIYALFPAIIAVLVAFNIVSEEQVSQLVSTIGLVAGGLTSLLAFNNTDPSQDVEEPDISAGDDNADN